MPMFSNSKRRIFYSPFSVGFKELREEEKENHPGHSITIYTNACDYQQRYNTYFTYDHMKI